MTGDSSDTIGGRYTSNRRTVLKSAVLGGAVLGGTTPAGAAGSESGPDSGNADDAGGFPPKGITEYGREIEVGDGRVRVFTSETPSGEPKYHGVEFEREALDGLPNAGGLETADNQAETDKYRVGGQATKVHFKWSQQYFVPFPDAADTPFTFLGLNWNPTGHYGGAGAWLKPHFDVHFHMLDPATVDSIGGPRLPPYDTGNGKYTGGSPDPNPDGKVKETNFNYAQLPEGYARAPDPVADQRYITDMGEHTAPVDAPELPDAPDERGNPDAFTNTLIQGFVGVGSNGEEGSRLAFVEPMVTRDFLTGFTGTEEYDVPQPDEYPHDQQHPTEYSVREVPSNDTVAVVLQAFESV